MRIESNSCFHTLGFDSLQCAVQMGTSLVVHREYVATQLCKGTDIAVGVDNH